jgi:Tfp pilus assembly protein PilN
MRAVNLLPRDAERQRSEGGRAPLYVAAGGIAAVTAVMVVLFMSASGSIDDQQARLDSVEAAISRIDDAGQPTVAPSAVAQERTDRVAALSAALSTRVPLDRLLRELAFVLPEDAWLTGISAAAQSGTAVAAVPGATATSQGVTIQGATYSLSSVARVLSRLAAIPSLTGVRLIASARVDPAEQAAGATTKTKGGKRVVTFSIGANLSTGSGT